MVKVYSKENCQQCKMVKQFLNRENIEFKEVDVEKDAFALDYVKNELGFTSLPVIEKDGSVAFKGFDIVKLRNLL